ncbi:MAG TPA: alpha/beta hydrolase [Thermoanaerobaculia bacterium]|nr:alpha/beta hydrolase [Thermoanaerobaculia bacterium]
MNLKRAKKTKTSLFALLLTLIPLAASAAASPEDLGLSSHSVKLETGIDMHYVEKGTGKGNVLIFLHGYTDSWRSFERNLPLVSDRFHVYALDQRGHGDSSKPECCYSQTDFAADVLAFMDALKIRKATLVGHSMGSFIAHKVAVLEPSRVERLVLIGGAATSAGNEVILGLNEAVQALEDPIDPVFVDEFQTSTFWPGNGVPREFIDTAVSESLKVPASVWKQALAGLLAEDHSADLGKVTAPTLILWGDQDGIFPFGDQQRLDILIPDSTLKLYVPESFPESAGPGSTGHGLHVEWPQRFVDELESFLRRPKVRPATTGSDKIYNETGQQGTCYGADCRQCRSAGFSTAHDQCVQWVVGARTSHRVRYSYTGATEGHDGAANLLMFKGDGVNDVCNISKGTCCGSDSGCPLGIGHCSGSSNSKVCTASQSCVGQFGPGGPMLDIGGATPLGFTGRLVHRPGGKPYDCDCTSGVEGTAGGFEVYVNANGTISGVYLWGPNEPNSGAGDITTQGFAYEVQTYKALSCGTFTDGIGCTNGATRKTAFTNIDFWAQSGGNPDFDIPSTCN